MSNIPTAQQVRCLEAYKEGREEAQTEGVLAGGFHALTSSIDEVLLINASEEEKEVAAAREQGYQDAKPSLWNW